MGQRDGGAAGGRFLGERTCFPSIIFSSRDNSCDNAGVDGAAALPRAALRWATRRRLAWALRLSITTALSIVCWNAAIGTRAKRSIISWSYSCRATMGGSGTSPASPLPSGPTLVLCISWLGWCASDGFAGGGASHAPCPKPDPPPPPPPPPPPLDVSTGWVSNHSAAAPRSPPVWASACSACERVKPISTSSFAAVFCCSLSFRQASRAFSIRSPPGVADAAARAFWAIGLGKPIPMSSLSWPSV